MPLKINLGFVEFGENYKNSLRLTWKWVSVGLMKYFNLDIKKRVGRWRCAQEKGKAPMRMGRNFSRKTYRD